MMLASAFVLAYVITTYPDLVADSRNSLPHGAVVYIIYRYNFFILFSACISLCFHRLKPIHFPRRPCPMSLHWREVSRFGLLKSHTAETFLRSAFTALLVALLPPGNWRQQTKVFSAARSTNCAPTTQLQLRSTHLTTLKLKTWWHVNFCAFCKLLWHALFVQKVQQHQFFTRPHINNKSEIRQAEWNTIQQLVPV